MTARKKPIEDEQVNLKEEGTLSHTPEITVRPPDEKDPPTLTEKLKDFTAAKKTRTTRAKRATKSKQIDANLISKLAPTIVATFAATYSRQLTPEPYKVCAPSQQEVLTIVSPLFNILSRSIEITGQASETVIDLITCAIASIIFGTRAYVTYATIKESEHNGKFNGSNGHVSAPSNTETNSGGSRNGRASEADKQSAREIQPTLSGFADDFTVIDSASSDDAQREAAKFAELFSKDIEGRIRLGVLPPRIRSENG